MNCEKCGKIITAEDGEYRYYQNRLIFACKDCAEKLDAEVLSAQKACTAMDSKKAEAEKILKNKDKFAKFLKEIEETLKKIPGVGNLLADVPLLVSLVQNYVEGKYTEIPVNTIVAVVAALLYVISPIDLIPDVIPIAGFADDAAVVAFCITMVHNDLERFKAWRDQESIKA